MTADAWPGEVASSARAHELVASALEGRAGDLPLLIAAADDEALRALVLSLVLHYAAALRDTYGPGAIDFCNQARDYFTRSDNS